ncbi:sugar transferase [Streptomyces sp. GS7]|uniref:sugar transferase n=1 Tax=Streptomyces sp. GS7 TaxID=2692234 RepID=UPI001316742A|nr:sugar transferase [Streptomyces sp. GS7]QHC20942.1 sugar transferase [Streptomyces sp. GS7]
MTTERADASRPPVLPPAPAGPPAAAVRPPRRPSPGPLPPARPGGAVRHRATHAALIAADLLATAGAALLPPGPGPAPALLGALATGLLLLHARAGLYRPGPAPAALNELPPLLVRAAAGWCAVVALSPGQPPHPAVLLGAVAVQAVLACAGRAAVYRVRRGVLRRRPRAALLVGPDPAARQLAAALTAHPEYGLRPVGLVACGLVPPGGAHPDLPWLGSAEEITRAVIRHTVRDAVFLVPPERDPDTAALLRRFLAQGSAVWLAGAGAARDGRPPEPGTGHLWGFACRPWEPAKPRPGGPSKRLLDLALAAVALVAAAPLLAGCALAVRLLDGPGVLCRRERVGRGGRPFTLLTFRTLGPGEAEGPAARGNAAGDARTGSVGRLLRRTSLDGLPQLWNVLRGDLGLVGPRPEHPVLAEQFTHRCAGYAARHRMPPGIIGPARVHGLHDDAPLEDRTRFDNLYIDSWSPWQDVRILLRTACPPLHRRRR